MAIVKVGTYRNPPEDITDYEAIVAHLEAYTRQIGNQGMILTEWTNTTNAPKIAMGSYISHGGVLYVVEDEDYALPALSVDGTYYIRVAVSGETLVITYTTNIADYSWNAVYGGLYHADESQVIPYQVVKNASAIEKYKMINPWQNNDFAVVNYLGRYYGRELHVTGAISGATVNTGQGANELYAMNQNVRTIDSPTFASINTGYGYNAVYRNTYVNYGTLLQTPSIIMDAMEIGEYRYVTAHFAPQGGEKNLFLPSEGSYIRIGGIEVYSGGSILDTASAGVTKSMAHLVRRIS